MKRMIFTLISAFALVESAVSCSDPLKKQYAALDRAIECQSQYDMAYQQRKDSLVAAMNDAQSDSLKWEIAFQLDQMLIYNNIDSCYRYIAEMLRLCGDDQRQRSVSQTRYVKYLCKNDFMQEALENFLLIDASTLSKEDLNLYYDAGYHVFRDIRPQLPEYKESQKRILEMWWQNDSTHSRCVFYNCKEQFMDGQVDDAVARLKSCSMKTLNDTAKVNDLLARIYMEYDDVESAKLHYAIAAECDMKLSAKTYNALYSLARILFREGDVERADRYMRVTRQDALASNYKSRFEKVFLAELEITNLLLQEQKEKKAAYLYGFMVTVILLGLAVVLVVMLGSYSSRLRVSRENLSVVSRIKDSFLAVYMERCVDYLNKVDQYRSSLRHAVKHEGPEAAIAMLRHPSFADGEFKKLLSDFDAAFLGIFPDFVDRVNEHMQPEYRLSMPPEGGLSTELRILALIRMGISKRPKIAKVLNMSVKTVYSYHCNLHKHSLHADGPFDEIIGSL